MNYTYLWLIYLIPMAICVVGFIIITKKEMRRDQENLALAIELDRLDEYKPWLRHHHILFRIALTFIPFANIAGACTVIEDLLGPWDEEFTRWLNSPLVPPKK